jgi:hypothetical protein
MWVITMLLNIIVDMSFSFRHCRQNLLLGSPILFPRTYKH